MKKLKKEKEKQFMANKYGHLGICDYDIIPRKNSFVVELYLEENYKDGGKTRIEIFKSKNNNYSSMFESENYELYILDEEFKTTHSIKQIKYYIKGEYKKKYKTAIQHFSEKINIVNLCEYASQIHNLINHTTYIYCLPLGYTFLLCNSITKKFPRDIAKLIAHKILFFLPQKIEKTKKKMMSPKEMQDVLNNSNVMVKKYLCKFLKKKYNFNFSNVSVCMGELIYIYVDNNFAIRIENYCYNTDLIHGNNIYVFYRSIVPFTMPIEAVKHNKDYKEEYLPIFMYFSKLENISNIYNYIDENYEFLYLTTYIQKLPLAYTFILSNNKNKIFPREIAKLIVRKLLFFIF